MTSSRDCGLGRQIALQIWNQRTLQHWTIGILAARAHLTIGQVLQAEIVCDDDEVLAAICAALGVDVNFILAQANGHLLLRDPGQGWDEVVVAEDDEAFPF